MMLIRESAVPLVLEHFSVGNWYSMQGPPVNRTVANVGWVRLFFNSSLANDDDRRAFTQRCQVSDACAMDDYNLRGASSYPPAATLKWKQIQPPRGDKEVATTILIICGGISFLLVCNALGRRVPWQKFRKSRPAPEVNQEKVPSDHSQEPRDYYSALQRLTAYTASAELILEDAIYPPTQPNSRAISYYLASAASSTPRLLSGRSSTEPMNINMNAFYQDEENNNEKRKSARLSWREFSAGYREAEPYKPSSAPRTPAKSITGDETPEVQQKAPETTRSSKHSSLEKGKFKSPVLMITPVQSTPEALTGVSLQEKMLGYGQEPTFTAHAAVQAESASRGFETRGPTQPAPVNPANMPAKKQRIDYLAGLVAFSALLVTAIHFCLTFAPAAINPGDYIHYDSEMWARKTIGSYFLNLIWIGKFCFPVGP